MRFGVIALLGVTAGCQISPKFAGLDQEDRAIAFAEPLQTETLANGLRVVIVRDARTNLVTVDMRYEVGAADDPRGRAGMAHYAEHVVWESGIRGAALDDATLFSNASTAHSSTVFSSIALDVELARALEIEARRLEVPCITIPDDVLTRERDVVIEEMKLRAGLAPAMDGLSAAVWGERHPFGKSAGGVAFASAPLTELCAFVSSHYVPRAATLVVTGNVTPGAIEIIRTRFGGIPDRAPPGRGVLPPVPPPGKDPVRVAGLERPTALLVFPVAPAGGNDDGLVELATAQLRARLREAGLSLANAFTLGDQRARVIVVYLEVDRADELAAAAQRVREAVAQPVGDDLDDLKRDARAQLALVYDRVWDRGRRIAELVATSRAPDLYRQLVQLEAVGAGRISAMLRGPARTVLLVPAGPATPGARIANLTTTLHRLDVSRAPVDPAEVLAPLAMPTARIERPTLAYSLANGLRVILAPDPSTIAVDARLVLPVGSDADPPDRRDLATYAASLLQPADGWSEGAYENRLVRWYHGRIGNRPMTGVSGRSTTFRATGIAVFADWHVWSLAWTVLHGEYPPALDSTLRHMREARARAPQRAVRLPRVDAVVKELLGDDAERPFDLSWVNRAELAKFRRAAYRPRGATLIVSGRFDVEAMKKEIATLFDAWPQHAGTAVVASVPARSPRLPAFVGIGDETATVTQLAIAYPPQGREGLPDRAARDTLAAMLDDRLRVIREGMGVSYGVGAIAGDRALVIAGSADNVHVPEAIAAIDREVTALRSSGPELAADFARARRLVLGRRLAAPIGATDRADELERVTTLGLPLDESAQLVTAVRTLAPQDLARAAAELAPGRRVVVLRGPRSSVYAAFAATGVSPDAITWYEPDR